MTAVSDMVNGWSGGVIQASRDSVFVTPTYLVNQLYAAHLGKNRLATQVESSTFDTTSEGKAVPFLDVVASRSADGKHLFIKAVNTDRSHALSATIVIRGAATVQQAGTMETIGGDTDVANSFRTPHAISISRAQLTSGKNLRVILPKASVSVIVLNF
jgi:alpha-L-arabinofuranosidase